MGEHFEGFSPRNTEFNFPYDLGSEWKRGKAIICSLGGPKGDCWECISHPRIKKGYAIVIRNKTRWLAHRYSYTVTKGEITDGLLVCHKCDNPSCINPNHLWLGTNADNIKDCTEKGRNNLINNQPRGEGKSSVLTEQQVIQIKIDLLSGKGVRPTARNYGVSKGAIDAIRRGDNWSWLEVTV